MKYIRFKSLVYSRDTIITFDKKTPHFEMARILQKGEFDVISAGFVRDTPEGIECYGESVSLRTRMQPDDTEVLRKQMNKPVEVF